MRTGESFIDVDFVQRPKKGQFVAGDVFICRKIKEEGRVIAVLSDGLGSGVKASVLANLTATMAIKYIQAFEGLGRSAATIMETLPVCEVRKISYSTFTILDLDEDGTCRFAEHGNPSLMLMRGARPVPFERESFTLEAWRDREIHFGQMKLEVGDRLVCCSDGVTQAGMGKPMMPLGWGQEGAMAYISSLLAGDLELSSHQVAGHLAAEAQRHDDGSAKDDISVAVVYFRHPRRLLVMTGPPFSRERDRTMADLALRYNGRKAIAGGTTATIIARELGREVEMDLRNLTADVPPMSRMPGIDLVTEGTLTLARVAELLDRGEISANGGGPAQAMIRLMLESDIVDFVVGTRINEAHQDPNVPGELDLRRNIIRRLTSTLESRYLKETSVQFL
jgi:hypothetical protein